MVNRGCTYLFSEVSKTFTFIWRVGDAPPSSAPLINASTIKSAVRSVGRRNRLLLIVSVKCCVFRSRVSSCVRAYVCALDWRVRANLLAWEWGTWFSRASHSAGSPLILVWGGLCFFRAIIYAVKSGALHSRPFVCTWLAMTLLSSGPVMHVKIGAYQTQRISFHYTAMTLCNSSPHNVVSFRTEKDKDRTVCTCVRANCNKLLVI